MSVVASVIFLYSIYILLFSHGKTKLVEQSREKTRKGAEASDCPAGFIALPSALLCSSRLPSVKLS